MGQVTSIILFMLTLSFGFSMAGYDTVAQSSYTWLACALGQSKAIGVPTCPPNSLVCPATYVPQLLPIIQIIPVISQLATTCFDFFSILILTFAIILGVGVTLGVLSFPNPYLLFAPMAIFLIGFFAFPIGIFNEVGGLPIEVSGFITIFFAFAYGMAVLGFIRGGPSP
jgi:hypothetical protein